MKSTSIHLLVTFDQNYIAPFETMLTSILLNNPGEQFHVWLLHSAIPQTALDALEHRLPCPRRSTDADCCGTAALSGRSHHKAVSTGNVLSAVGFPHPPSLTETGSLP